MPATNMTDTGSLRAAYLISQSLFIETRAARGFLPNHPAFSAYRTGESGQGSVTVQIPVSGLNGGDRLQVVADGVAPARTKKSFGSASVSVSRRAKAHPVTEGSKMFDPAQVIQDPAWIRDGLLAYNATLAELAHATAKGATNFSGSGSADIDVSVLVAAKIKLRNRNVGGQFLAALAGESWGKIEQDMLALGISWMPEAGNVLRIPGEMLGLLGNLFGFDVYIDNLVGKDSSSDFVNYMTAAGGLLWADTPHKPAPAGTLGEVFDYDGGKVRQARKFDPEVGEEVWYTGAWLGMALGDEGRIEKIIDDGS